MRAPLGPTPASASADVIAAHTRRKRRAISLSIATAAALTFLKLVVAAATGSVAVLSEAAHSMTDLVAAGVVLLAIQRASSPPDSRHRYGHEKIENASAMVEGSIILAAIAYVIFRTIERLTTGGEVDTPLLAAAVMGVSGAVNLIVSRLLRRVGRDTDSDAVRADATHLMTDVYTSFGACIGLTLVAITGYDIIDPLVALVVSVLVVMMGIRLIVGSARVLLDEGLPPEEIEMIERVIAEGFEGVAGFHRLRTRRAGSRRHVDLHLTLDGDLPLWRAHDIAHNVERAIETALPNVDVLTHLEPDSAAPPPGEDVGPGDRV
jgi:cation diffusion facilitator family transporter